jgi:hypothetical protein
LAALREASWALAAANRATIAGTPDVANGDPLGGGGPRQLQLALKLIF